MFLIGRHELLFDEQLIPIVLIDVALSFLLHESLRSRWAPEQQLVGPLHLVRLEILNGHMTDEYQRNDPP